MKVTHMILSRMPIKLWEFLSALTGSSERDFEDERKRSVLAFFMILGIGITFPFSIYHFTLGNVTRAILLLFVGSVQLASLVALHFLTRANIIFRLNVILLGVYFLFLIIVGGTHGSRILWVFIFPIFAFFLLGKKEGLFWSALFFLLSLVLFVIPANFFQVYPYENEIKTRFLITYTVLVLMGYFVEATRQKYHEGFRDYTGFLATLAAIRGVGHEKSEETLWQVFLSSLVKENGFLMAWYGSYSEGRVIPTYSAGRVDRYLDDLVLEIREPTSSDARCAMSRSILDRKPFGYKDLAHDEGFLRWRQYALELGYRSNVALPFEVDGRIEGGIMIYAGTAAAFPKKRVDHLHLLTSEMRNTLQERRLARQTQEALQQSYDQLEEQVEIRTADLRDANEKLKKEILERQHAEEALKASKQEKEIILSSLMEHVIYEDRKMKILWANRAACESAGINQEEIIGRYSYEIWNHRENLYPDCPVKKAMETGEPQEIEWTTPDGKAWIIRGYPVHDVNDEIIGGIEVTLDITERKRMELALKEANDIINKSPAVAFLWKNEEGWPVEFVSDNVMELFGYSVDEFTSDQISYAETVHPDDLERVAKEVATFSNEKERIGFVHEPYRIISKDGNVRWLDDRTYIRRDNKGHITHYEGIVVDITDSMQAAEALRENEEKLARSKKMESLGLLAGGVAHDLNNVLAGIVSYPELLLLDLPSDSQFRKAIETIKESGDRAVAIVQDLLTVARGVATTKEPLNLNDLIGDYLHSPEFNRLEQFHPTVRVKTSLDTELLNISGSYVHIRKVLMNLVSNASEAIKGSGNVTISTVNRYVDAPLKGYDDIKVGEYAVLSVSDDGSGISSDDLERIFEPFYTKKVMGRSGTGLGLAVVWNVVQDHQGYLDVTSNHNGTTFELFFPITREKISGGDLSTPFQDWKGNREKILVIDDVESQRDISCKMLETLGYKTKAVSSGEEAVEYLKENTVDLILLDMIMDPGINGRETYERIIKIHPNQKAIIVSGFAETDEVKQTQKIGAGRYIKKPLTLERIGLAIKEELGK